jgi:hypothetical protein
MPATFFQWVVVFTLICAGFFLLSLSRWREDLADPIGYGEISELKGIRLGENIFDVLFRFDFFLDKRNDSEDWGDAVRYTLINGRISVGVKGEYVHNVTYVCNETLDITSVAGVYCGDRTEKLSGKHLSEARLLCHKKFPDIRAVDLIHNGVRYFSKNNVVTGFLITDSKSLGGAASGAWIYCA